MDEFKIWVGEHFEHIIKRRVEAVIDHYANSEQLYVHVEGPRWSTTGFERVSKGWRDFFNSAIYVDDIIWVEGPVIHSGLSMASISGIIDMHIRVEDKTQQVRFRGTYVLQKHSDGQWRIIHEHFSQPATNPYGIGDWLKPD